jgi:transposase
MEIDRKNLPNDPELLREMVGGLLDRLDANEREIARLRHMMEKLLRARYGPKRERVDENQLFLFAVAIVGRNKDIPPAEPEAQPKPKVKRNGHGRQRLPKSLERRRVTYDLGEGERQCPECQGELRKIGEEISERLEYVPASFHVIEETCVKYACRK